MNIFLLDRDPEKAAVAQCDKHIVKMPTEAAQMLCAAFPHGEAPYKRTHYNHICTRWVRESRANYAWMLVHGMALCAEYTFRYGKVIKSQEAISWCAENMGKLEFDRRTSTPFVQAMPLAYRHGDPVVGYRTYYAIEKRRFARWTKGRAAPSWWRTDLPSALLDLAEARTFASGPSATPVGQSAANL